MQGEGRGGLGVGTVQGSLLLPAAGVVEEPSWSADGPSEGFMEKATSLLGDQTT